MVNITDYVSNELEEYIENSKIYNLIDPISATNTYKFRLKNGLITGTYKLEFRLYDGTEYVGNVIKYIIIK